MSGKNPEGKRAKPFIGSKKGFFIACVKYTEEYTGIARRGNL
jgi:hypothetical protein